MRILVTGGKGFLGAWIVRRLLARGLQVRIFDVVEDRRLLRDIVGDAALAPDWRVGDIVDGAQVRAAAAGCDGIIHLAGVLTPDCQADPVRGAEINLIGTLNVFEAARAQGGAKVVYTSSAGVFGPQDGRTPFPMTHYGAFKLACEGSARAYWADHRLASIGFRPFVVYGAGRESGSSAGPSLACRAAVRGERYTIPYTGRTGLIYADDVAAAYEAAILHPAAGPLVFNLPGVPTTTDEVIDAIRRIVPGAAIDAAGPPLPIAPDVDPGDLAEVLPGLARTSLDDGLAETVAFYRRTAPAA